MADGDAVGAHSNRDDQFSGSSQSSSKVIDHEPAAPEQELDCSNVHRGVLQDAMRLFPQDLLGAWMEALHLCRALELDEQLLRNEGLEMILDESNKRHPDDATCAFEWALSMCTTLALDEGCLRQRAQERAQSLPSTPNLPVGQSAVHQSAVQSHGAVSTDGPSTANGADWSLEQERLASIQRKAELEAEIAALEAILERKPRIQPQTPKYAQDRYDEMLANASMRAGRSMNSSQSSNRVDMLQVADTTLPLLCCCLDSCCGLCRIH